MNGLLGPSSGLLMFSVCFKLDLRQMAVQTQKSLTQTDKHQPPVILLLCVCVCSSADDDVDKCHLNDTSYFTAILVLNTDEIIIMYHGFTTVKTTKTW